ncbi:protein yellow [Calliphora vicina]|uniref:protein yellow n=1 Tax=Calliphora vicina TaxID=7373 RepID=UPI00325B5321
MNILYSSALVCCFCIIQIQAYKSSYVHHNNNGVQQQEFLSLYPHAVYGNADQQPVYSGPGKQTKTKLFEIVNEWKYLDFEYLTYEQRRRAIENREFIPENNLPLGIDFYENRIFITTPRWKDGVPASFGYLNYPPAERSPAIKPYPNWEAHSDPYNPDCSKLISVYRTFIDSCKRIFLIDSGIVNATVSLNQVCPPKIVAFDLRTNEKIVHYDFPASQIKEDSLHSNIVVDVTDDRCDDAHVYVTDVWRFGILVYSLRKNRSWRVTNYNFSPDPVASDFNVYGLNFQWLDGVFGMSMSLPKISTNERVLYFHPMASFKEFMVSTSLLKDENIWIADAQKVAKYFVPIGERGEFGQSSTSGIAQNGVMFFTQVHRDDIGCWDTSKSYGQNNIHRFFDNGPKANNGGKNVTETLIQFPNDLKVDHEPLPHQNIWVISNRLPIYLYSQLNYDEINFRILKANVANLIANTVCDPLESPGPLEGAVA